jgi:hypothetical protein
MMIGVSYGQLNVFACALFAAALTLAGEAFASSRAAELGPEMPMAEPAGGFVGNVSVTPTSGPAGTQVTVSGEAFATPDDLGGVHALWVATGNDKKQGAFWIAPTALPLDVMRGPVGTTFRIHLKGVGWSETANIYTVLYDNATSGYACAFNSQGDIEIFLQATGEPGWHFIDLYPAIYKGKETRPNNYRLPQLTYADDHPGEDLPRFRFAFEVTPPIVQ